MHVQFTLIRKRQAQRVYRNKYKSHQQSEYHHTQVKGRKYSVKCRAQDSNLYRTVAIGFCVYIIKLGITLGPGITTFEKQRC